MTAVCCPCGARLDPTVFHDDSVDGSQLCESCCPTCTPTSGEDPMTTEITTVEQLDAQPFQAVVLDSEGDPWRKRYDGTWAFWGLIRPAAKLLVHWGPLTLIHPVPEADHSMCARLDPEPGGHSTSVPLQGWHVLRTPDGRPTTAFSPDSARSHGFALPEPAKPTVIERAAEVLANVEDIFATWHTHAQALADAGLLREDDDQ